MAVQSVIGGEVAWVADPDPGTAAVLAHRFPSAPNLGDITAVGWRRPDDGYAAGPAQGSRLWRLPGEAGGEAA